MADFFLYLHMGPDSVLNSVLNRCSLGLLRAHCYHCSPFSLLIARIYLPVCQSSEVSWFLVFRWIILCTLVTSPCVVSLKFLLKKKKEKRTFHLPLFLVLKALSVQHLFNFAFQPRQLTFTFLLCQIVRVPKALHSFFIFRKNIHHFYISLNNWQGEFSYIVMTLEIGNLSPFTDKKNEAPRVKLPAQGHITRTGSSRVRIFCLPAEYVISPAWWEGGVRFQAAVWGVVSTQATLLFFLLKHTLVSLQLWELLSPLALSPCPGALERLTCFQHRLPSALSVPPQPCL